MRRRRREQAEVRAQAQALAALSLAAGHAEAGLYAQLRDDSFGWAPPGEPAYPQTVAAAAPPIEIQAEFLRVLEVVASMCDHVIEYIEADRAERRAMVETLGQLTRALGEARAPVEAPRERVIGGSMPAGPDPLADLRGVDRLIDLRETDIVIDLREPELFDLEPDIVALNEPDDAIDLRDPQPAVAATAVEVRCRFGEGERWVGGFEIVEVTHYEGVTHYQLRRQRDGAILPQLFDAANIRHIETFEELTAPDDRRWSRL